MVDAKTGVNLSSAASIIPQSMSIYETIATIDDLNRKMQGRPSRPPGVSPFGKYAEDETSEEFMDNLMSIMRKRKPRKPR